MQYSVVNYKTVKENSRDFRIDAEFFKPQHIKTLQLIAKIKTKPLSYFAKDGYRVVYENTKILSNEDLLQTKSVNFLQANNISGYFLNDDMGKVTYDDWLRYKKGRIKHGEILIEVKGNAEKISLVPVDFPTNTLVSGSLYKFTPINVSGEFLLTWLTCKYGQNLKNKLKRNLMVHFIGKEDLYNIPVPLFSNRLQQIIEQLVKDSFQKQFNSKSLYSQAEQLLLSELGLTDWKPKHELAFIKNYSDTKEAERFDTEYFQPKYEEIVEVVKKYKGGFDELGNLVKIKKCVEPGSSAYQEDGVPFVRVSNLSKFEISTNNQRFISEELYEELKRHQPKKDEILLSKDATLGIAYHLKNEPKQMIPSGGILRLKIKESKVLPEYLTLVLNSTIVQKQIERDAGGSIIKHWRPDQVKATIIPILKNDKQKEIKELIEKSFSDRKLSKSLLEIAKHGVEMAIEKGENEAEKWINNEI